MGGARFHIITLVIACWTAATFFLSVVHTTCVSSPSLPPNTMISNDFDSVGPRRTEPPFQDNDKVYFKCVEGYYPSDDVWWKYSLTCQNNLWTRDDPQVTCLKAPCGSGQRSCGDGTCISESKWCDCIPDCSTRKDEKSCPAYPVNLSKGKSGSITKLLFENGYKNNIDCTLNISITAGKKFNFQFSTFDLRTPTGMSCNDYITLSNVDYGDRSVLCLSTLCPFCGTAPIGLSSKSNWVGVRFVSTANAPDHKGLMIDWQVVKRKGGSASSTIMVIGGVLVCVGVVVAAVVFVAIRCKRRGQFSHAHFVAT